MDKQPYVKTEERDGISIVEFYHPAHNSLPGNLLADLRDQILAEGYKDHVNIILLRSAGDRTFCAGASFNELASIDNPEDGKRFFMGFADVINAIRSCGKIVVGRIQGKAVGGGVGLASACDYVMSTKFASVKLSELAVGIGPFVIGPAVERKVGLSAFSQMALNATEWQTAEWAKSRGLFQEVFETTEQLDEYLDHFLNILNSSNPVALAELKKVFWQNTDDWDQLLMKRAETSGRLVLSTHARSAINRFLNP